MGYLFKVIFSTLCLLTPISIFLFYGILALLFKPLNDDKYIKIVCIIALVAWAIALLGKFIPFMIRTIKRIIESFIIIHLFLATTYLYILVGGAIIHGALSYYFVGMRTLESWILTGKISLSIWAIPVIANIYKWVNEYTKYTLKPAFQPAIDMVTNARIKIIGIKNKYIEYKREENIKEVIEETENEEGTKI